MNKPDGPAIVKISTTGNESNFAVWNVDGSGESIDLLVNEIGNYAGVRAIDFRSDEKTSRFEVTADGSWKIEVKPVSSARKASVPGSVSGHGDEVMVLSGSSPDTAAIEHSGESNFAVTSYDTLGADLLVNEIGPYSGTIAMRNADVLEIKADGEWSIDFR